MRKTLRLLFSSWFILAAGIVVVGAAVFPWRSAGPSIYRGLDSNLIFVEAVDSQETSRPVVIEPDRAILMPSASRLAIHLLSSENAFSSDFDVVFRPLGSDNAVLPDLPLRVRVWHPSITDSAFILFSQGRTISMGRPGAEGETAEEVGPFQVGGSYHIHIVWQQGSGGSLSLTMPSGAIATERVDSTSGSPLTRAPWVDLSIDTAASQPS